MPVQIPTLNRIAPQEAPSVGRIETSVANTAPETAAIGHAAGSVVNEVADYQAKVAEHAIEVGAISGNNTYEVGERELLGQAKKLQGDPSAFYDKIDQERQQRQDDIIAETPNLTPRLEQAMREKFMVSDTNLREKQATQHALQYEAYKQKTFDDSLALLGQGVLDTSASIDPLAPKDPSGVNSSLQSMQSQIGQIKKMVINQSIMNGLATKGEDGVLDLSPTAKMNLKKATDGPVKDVVDTLIRSGKPDAAKLVLEQFSDDMLSRTKAGLMNDHKDSMLKVKAAGISEGLISKYPNPADRWAALDGITDPLEKIEVRKNLNIAENEKEHNDKQAGKYFADKITSYIQANNKDPNRTPLTTKDQIDNSPAIQSMFKAAGTRLDAKERNAIIEDATGGSNKVSSASAYTHLQDKVVSGEIASMSDADLVQASYGLNQQDRNYFKQKAAQAKDPASADNVKRDRFMLTNLKTALADAEIISPSGFGLGGGSKYTTEDNNNLYRMQQAFAPIMEATHDKSESGQLKAINQFVAKQKLNDTYKKTLEKPAFQGSFTPPKDVELPDLTAKTKQGWLSYFRETEGHALGAGESLTDFRKKMDGKLPSKYSAGE